MATAAWGRGETNRNDPPISHPHPAESRVSTPVAGVAGRGRTDMPHIISGVTTPRRPGRGLAGETAKGVRFQPTIAAQSGRKSSQSVLIESASARVRYRSQWIHRWRGLSSPRFPHGGVDTPRRSFSIFPVSSPLFRPVCGHAVQRCGPPRYCGSPYSGYCVSAGRTTFRHHAPS